MIVLGSIYYSRMCVQYLCSAAFTEQNYYKAVKTSQGSAELKLYYLMAPGPINIAFKHSKLILLTNNRKDAIWEHYFSTRVY